MISARPGVGKRADAPGTTTTTTLSQAAVDRMEVSIASGVRSVGTVAARHAWR